MSNTDISIEPIRQYGRLTTEITEMEARLNSLKSQRADLEPLVITTLQESGMKRIELNNPNVVLSINPVYAGTVKDPDTFHRRMKENGFKDIVKESVNYQTMRRVIREWNEAYQEGAAEDMVESVTDTGQGTGVFMPSWVGDSMQSYIIPKISVRKGAQ